MKSLSTFNLKRLATGTTFLLVGTGAALIFLMAVPFYEADQEPMIAETYAQSVIKDLHGKLAGPQAEILSLKGIDSIELSSLSGELIDRNLFSRVTNEAPPQFGDILGTAPLRTLESILSSSNSQPADESKPATLGPVLGGIFIDGKSAHAVIDDCVVTRGDLVRGYRIIGIFRESVLLSKGDIIVELRLKGK
jgi:hypothetical protein